MAAKLGLGANPTGPSCLPFQREELNSSLSPFLAERSAQRVAFMITSPSWAQACSAMTGR